MPSWASLGQPGISTPQLYRRDGGRCHICGNGCRRATATPDHVIPKRDGGSRSPDNLALAHWGCNTDRQAVPLGEYLDLRRALGLPVAPLEWRLRHPCRGVREAAQAEAEKPLDSTPGAE